MSVKSELESRAWAEDLEAHHKDQERREAAAKERYEQGKAADILRASIRATMTIAANTRCDIQGGYAEAHKFGEQLHEMLKRLDQYREG